MVKMSKVIVADCGSYDIQLLKSKINSGIELLGGWERFVSPGMKVLLKINLIGPKTPDSAAITHTAFVQALTQILKELGCTVWIGDSSGGAIGGISPTTRSFAVSGLEDMAKKEGAIIKNFDKEGVAAVQPESGCTDKMYIARPMFEADFVINLPKFKTHSAAVYTGAVKNLFGCIPGLRKAEYHKIAATPDKFGEVIADIHKAVDVGLHIMDGITAMQGEGPTAGEPYHAGKILMSTDPLALDTVALAMLGVKVDNVPMLVTAGERGLGESRLDKIEIAGDYVAPPRLQGFRLPKRYVRKRENVNSAIMVKIINFLKSRPRINLRSCKHCNMCVESCPAGAINRDTKKIDYGKCIECMCCHELCQYKAVELKRDYRLADIILRIFNMS